VGERAPLCSQRTFIAQVSLMMITIYDCQIFILQTTGENCRKGLRASQGLFMFISTFVLLVFCCKKMKSKKFSIFFCFESSNYLLKHLKNYKSRRTGKSGRRHFSKNCEKSKSSSSSILFSSLNFRVQCC
jgi:hypothetical protein